MSIVFDQQDLKSSKGAGTIMDVNWSNSGLIYKDIACSKSVNNEGNVQCDALKDLFCPQNKDID